MPITHFLASTSSGETTSRAHCQNSIEQRVIREDSPCTDCEIQSILIDTDAGIDDAWALFMLLEAHKNPNIPVKIEGITCVHGNTTVDNVVKNVSRILKVARVTNITVYKGCETAFAIPFKENGDSGVAFNGKDGFGDAELPKLGTTSVNDEHAVNAIVRLAQKFKGNLTIIALGPLTNLAMALRIQPKINQCIKDIFAVGGNMEGHGNATACGEFNFVADVESAHVVLSNFLCPIYLIPWETCMRYGTFSYSWRLKTIGSIQTEQMNLLNAIEQRILDEFHDGWMACDALAAAVFLEPSIVKTQEPYHCAVELHGTHSRGLMIIDRTYKFQKAPNVMIIKEIDMPLLEKMLVWAVGGPYYTRE